MKLILCMLVAQAAILRGGMALAAESGGDDSGAVLKVPLEYTETREPISIRGMLLGGAPGPFETEPDLGRRPVFRCRLFLAPHPTNSVAAIWDYTEGRLHLDLNRNQDLTDDPDGVFSSPRKGTHQTFTNLHVALHTPDARRILTDLTLTRYGSSQVYGSISLRSFWQGKAVLQGKEWQVGLIEDNVGDRSSAQRALLVLRPWARRADKLSLVGGTPDALTMPKTLFVNGQSYAVSCQFADEGGGRECALEFKNLPVALAEAEVSGSLLHRIILEDGRGGAVVLDEPKGVVMLPPGSYKAGEVWLKHGRHLAMRDSKSRLTVSEQERARLVAGGPLTNSVKVSRYGKRLVLEYQLGGADGAIYRLTPQDSSQPPQFAVYHDGKKLVSGKFAYG